MYGISSPNELLHVVMTIGAGELIVSFEHVKSFQTAKIQWAQLVNGE